MANLYLLNYNNYGNRLLRRAGAIHTYEQADPNCLVFEDINFNKNDGVSTTQTINYAAGTADKDPDYLVVAEPSTPEDTIISRWFVTECVWNRKHQQILTLRRDILADYFNLLYNSTDANNIFCEKGNLEVSDNFIFNDENMSFNQILKSQTKCGSGNGYIVGYLDRSYVGGNTTPDLLQYESIENHPLYSLLGKRLYSNTKYYLQMYIGKSSPSSYAQIDGYKCQVPLNGGSPAFTRDSKASPYIFQPNLTLAQAQSITARLSSISVGQFIGYAQSRGYTDNYSNWSNYNNTYFVAGGTYYKVVFDAVTGNTESIVCNSDLFSIVRNHLSSSFPSIEWTNMLDGDNIQMQMISNQYIPRFEVVSASQTGAIDVNVPSPEDRAHTNQPYDIFVAAYTSQALKDASTIASALKGSGALIDLQRLPWAPHDTTHGTWTVGSTPFYWQTSDNTSGTWSGKTLTMPTSALDAKVGYHTTMWRIVSPNHSNAFDFNPYANGGISVWNYETTLKPYQPYIHFYPTFARLYGTNPTYDSRGLICTGSFSLAISSSAWATYQIQNASYQNAFDRRVENLITSQNVDRINQKWGIVAGAVSGAVSGATSGALMGGVAGGVAGGIIAGAGSLAAGIADYNLSETLRNEAIDYMKDQFGYSMQNIRALPNTFSQSSSFDINNSIFPVIEVYEASDIEKTAFRNKIKMNGMTIMRLGTFKEFVDYIINANEGVKYFKCRLIRSTGMKDDTHLFNELANELYKGFFMEE